MMKDKKGTIKVIVNFNNPEAKMKLITIGKNATENSLKYMKAFDKVCKEIKEAGDETKES